MINLLLKGALLVFLGVLAVGCIIGCIWFAYVAFSFCLYMIAVAIVSIFEIIDDFFIFIGDIIYWFRKKFAK